MKLPILSPSVNELVIRRHMTDDDDATLTQLHDAVKACREAALKAREVTDAVLADATQTSAANHKRARDSGFALLEGATRAVDAALKTANGEIAAIAAKTKGPTVNRDPITESKQREIRERLTLLSEDRRKAIIQQAIKNDDNLLLSAVLNSPAWLSGFAEHDLSMTRHAWMEKHFKADLERASLLEKAIGDTMQAGQFTITFISQLTDADLIEQADTKAKAAKNALASAKA